jgi:hypothetical protein
VGGTIYAATPPFQHSTGAILILADQTGDRGLVPSGGGDLCSGPIGHLSGGAGRPQDQSPLTRLIRAGMRLPAGYWCTVGRGTLAFARGSSTVEPPCGCSGSSRPPGCSWCSPSCLYRCGRADSPPRPWATPRTSWPRAAQCQVSSRPRCGIASRRCAPRSSARARADVWCRCCLACWPPHWRSCTGWVWDGCGPARPGPGRSSEPPLEGLGRRPPSSRPDRRPRGLVIRRG